MLAKNPAEAYKYCIRIILYMMILKAIVAKNQYSKDPGLNSFGEVYI